jgi:hypothetical protein
MRAGVAALLLVAATGCATHAPPPPPSPPPEGRTSARVLVDASIEAVPPKPAAETITNIFAKDDNPLPEYPGYALRHGCTKGTVAVRLVIGTDGNVSSQQDVPRRPLGNDPCLVAFRAAVQTAVSGWRFSPAFRLRRVPGPDRDGDGRPDFDRWDQTPIVVYVDYEFLFEVVEGKGVVRSR